MCKRLKSECISMLRWVSLKRVSRLSVLKTDVCIYDTRERSGQRGALPPSGTLLLLNKEQRQVETTAACWGTPTLYVQSASSCMYCRTHRAVRMAQVGTDRLICTAGLTGL